MIPKAEDTQAMLTRIVTNESQWDQPPRLLVLWRDLLGQANTLTVPVGDEQWAYAHPPMVLAAMAERMLATRWEIAGKVPPELYGIAFVCEAWMVLADDADPARTAQVMADSAAKMLHSRPDRVEVRMACAIDLTGRRFLVLLERESADLVAETLDHTHSPGRWGASGAVFDALSGMMEALGCASIN